MAFPTPNHSFPKKHILIAPACFKGSLSAPEAAVLIWDFLRERLPEETELLLCPIADGGDDTLAVLREADPAFCVECVEVTGPVPERRVRAKYLYHPDKDVAVIEAAQAHGLKLLPPEALSPMEATSYGVGELIRYVMDVVSPEEIIVTVGGSASTDGGLGALQALGVPLLDESGRLMDDPVGGGALRKIARIIRPPRWPYAGRIRILTDVVNPLLGPEGCAAVFARQKGANDEQIQELEAGLRHVSGLLCEAFGEDLSALPGSGAAGGLAYGLRHLPQSGVTSGTQWIAEQLDLEKKVRRADIIMTGEGRLDATSFAGKATGHLLALSAGKPVFALCGTVESSLRELAGIFVFSLTEGGVSVSQAMANPAPFLVRRLEDALPVLMKELQGHDG